MNRQTRPRLFLTRHLILVTIAMLLLVFAVPATAKKVIAITSADIADGTIKNVDIASDAAIDASKLNSTGLNADTLDGSHASAFAPTAHNHAHDHGSDYADLTHDHDSDYIATGATISNSQISYDSTKAAKLVIPSSALLPDEDDYDYRRLGGTYLRSGTGYFYAPVNLPQGAIVTKLTYWHYDRAPGATYVELLSKNLRETWLRPMAETSDSVNSALWQSLEDSDIDYPQIDYDLYYYYVRVYLGGAGVTHRAGSIIIDYTYTSPN